jgi:hypothetical protein
VAEHRVGVHDAGDRQAVLRLGVVDRVAADDGGAGGRHHVVAPAQDLAQHVAAEALEREGDEVQRGDRPPPIA